MQWNVSLTQALLHTLLIGSSVAILSTCAASFLALCTFWIRIVGWRLAIGLISSFLLVPLYVQATAWSAGFGSYGWLKLSQVAAAKSPWWGVASVIWIHSCAAIPSCFWILALGLLRARSAKLDQCLIEFGPGYALRHHLLPLLKPWIYASLLWSFSCVQYDMVVTNLFQIPTLCESIYQQVQFGRLRGGPISLAWGLAAVCGISLAALVAKHFSSGDAVPQRQALSHAPQTNRTPQFVWPSTFWIVSGIAWSILLPLTVIPWCNLVSRMGWNAKVIDGKPMRTWTWAESWSSLLHVRDFHEEIGWSLQLCLWAAGISLLLSLGLLLLCRGRIGRYLAIALCGFMLALPGPLINLCVGQLFQKILPASWNFLSDDTLIAPILALQFRTLPIVFGVLWIGVTSYKLRYDDLLRLERGLPILSRLWLALRYLVRSLVTALLLGFSVAFGDLASYLLVQPPGVTTVAMRMFDLLHYGTKNREAGLAVVLAFFGTASSIAWIFLTTSRAPKRQDHN